MVSRLMTLNTERKKLIFLKDKKRNKFVQTETHKLLFIAQQREREREREKQNMADKDRHVRLENEKEETCWCICETTNKHTPEGKKEARKSFYSTSSQIMTIGKRIMSIIGCRCN